MIFLKTRGLTNWLRLEFGLETKAFERKMSYGYRVQNEYTSFPFLTRIAGTYSFLVTLGIIFGKVSPVKNIDFVAVK